MSLVSLFTVFSSHLSINRSKNFERKKSTADAGEIVNNVDLVKNSLNSGLIFEPKSLTEGQPSPKNEYGSLGRTMSYSSRPFMKSFFTATYNFYLDLVENKSDHAKASCESTELSTIKPNSYRRCPFSCLVPNPSNPLAKNLVKKLSISLCDPLTKAHEDRTKAAMAWEWLDHLSKNRVKNSSFRDRNHRSAIKSKVTNESMDIEENPGPEAASKKSITHDVMVTSYNVRGLGDENKLRHLINHCYSKLGGKDKDYIACFQESYIRNPGKIPYMWRGNFHLTPGTGNSVGCLTLLSNHINVLEAVSLDNRAHVLACRKTGDDHVSLIVANVYAPNPHNNEKINFFENVFELLSEMEIKHNCKNFIIVGDFNLTFNSKEVKNRLLPAAEKRIANVVKNLSSHFDLKDIWETQNMFTWNRPGTDVFSTIDRILFNPQLLNLTKCNTNWALSLSDHAAVESFFTYEKNSNGTKSKITRLDPSLLKNPDLKSKIISEFNEMYAGGPQDWNPHMKLEFAKLCIRTVTEKVQAEAKRSEKCEEEIISEELNLAIKALENPLTNDRNKAGIIEYVEELRGKKALLVEERGKRLAEKLGTKWYNEGEKSTRYFLRILQRPLPDKFKVVTDPEGNLVVDESQIEEEIVNFYKSLYEDYDSSNLNVNDNAFFENISAISANEEDEVVQPISVEELWTTLASCSDSAPGPDGIPYSYLVNLWQVMGPLMVDAWNYSLQVGKLCPSHKISFLKLIPKIGKDLKNLTNWRPITLSNCDHKLITKTYSNRLCARLNSVLKERQTAYLKGRLINDNIRSILATINISNLEEKIDGILVSLDAKKAFDSVEHSYIENCLRKFGVGKFIPIFRILYAELRSDIIINRKIVPGFLTKRGVKQGDALSCILFIMCMEPLLRNIETNPAIVPIHSEKLASDLPKSYAYADDVSSIISNRAECLQELFNEYARLTRMSGLELNADKTELMVVNKVFNERNRSKIFEIEYLGKIYRIETRKETKINGILFQQDQDQMKDSNVAAAIRKIEENMRRWSTRHLSLLGKILITKTFGISQVIYIMQSFALDERHIKAINASLYKFLWNKHYQAAKAPERIKREIVNTPIDLGGFGMLDIVQLDDSIKLRALGRVLLTKHPFLSLIRNFLDLSGFFNPKIKSQADSVTAKAVRLLKQDRLKLLGDPNLERNLTYISLVKHSRLSDIVNEKSRNSLLLLGLRARGALAVKDLNQTELDRIRKLLPTIAYEEASRLIPFNYRTLTSEDKTLYLENKMLKQLSSLTSKQIRQARSEPSPICIYKFGMILNPTEVLNWGSLIRKLNSVRHKNVLLRVAHGEIYTKEKLHRYGLADTPACLNCNEVETLQHKIYECGYSHRIWLETLKLTDKLLVSPQPNVDIAQRILGANGHLDKTALTVHAEIILRLLAIRQSTSYLLRPKVLIKHALNYLKVKENCESFKTKIDSLLSDLN